VGNIFKLQSWLNLNIKPSTTSIICCAAIGYWLFGYAAGFFAIPPGFASPIWPAAGFALLVGLHLGYRVLPGILIASFILNMNLSGNAWLEPTIAWLVPFAIACGAVIQTALAIWLAEKVITFNANIASSKIIILLALTLVPATSLVSASMGITTLWLAGIMPDEVLVINWLNWWIGDSIGVFIFCPIIVAINLIGKNIKTLIPFFIPYLVLNLVVIILFSQARADQVAKQQDIFDAKALGMRTAIIKQTDNILHASKTLTSMFSLFDFISFQQFQDYTVSIYDNIPGTHALSWIPEIPDAQRSIYEQKMSIELNEKYEFKERNTSGELVTAVVRDVYYPVYYIAPLASNRPALGFDIASHPGRKVAIDHAFKKKGAVATEPITLVQETEKQFAFLLLTPILTTDKKSLGLISAVYRAKELLSSALDNRLMDVSIQVIDITDNAVPLQFFDNGLSASYINWQGTINFAERIWQIRLSPTTQSLYKAQGQEVWVVLIAGFSLIGIIGLFLLSLINRKALVDNLVKDKIRELSLALDETCKAQTKIIESEAQVRTIVETVVDGIITINSVGKIKTFNPAAERMFGYSLAEVLDKNVHLLMPEPYHTGHDSYLKNYFNTIGIDREVIGKRKDGSEFPLDLAVSEMKINDQRMFTGVVRDITERKNAKIQLTKALKIADEKAIELQHFVDELSKSNQELDQYAYVASHDLKSPLQAIGQLSSWIQEDCFDLLPESSQKHFKLLQQRIKRMENLLADLLAYSRIGRDEYLWEEINLDELARNIFDLNCFNSKFILKCDTNNVVCLLPRVPIELVLRNLMSNAIKHHDHSTGIICISYEDSNTHHVISISDDGPGIPLEYHEKVLDMFQTLKPRDEVEGSGMGLALVKKSVFFYGGKLDIISNGRGTKITTFWPKRA
jgi:PAS domain S-box-containing protein